MHKTVGEALPCQNIFIALSLSPRPAPILSFPPPLARSFSWRRLRRVSHLCYPFHTVITHLYTYPQPSSALRVLFILPLSLSLSFFSLRRSPRACRDASSFRGGSVWVFRIDRRRDSRQEPRYGNFAPSPGGEGAGDSLCRTEIELGKPRGEARSSAGRPHATARAFTLL